MDILRKMVLGALAVLVLGAGMVSAEEPKGGDQAPAVLPSTRTLARDYPVITVEGCAPASTTASKSGACKTVITRDEFEELVQAVNPRMTKAERRQLAQNYGRMLALENEALRRGIDKKPETRALLRYLRASALGGGAFRQVLREAAKASDAEVEKYYKENQAMYDRYTLERLFIPMVKQQSQAKSLEQVAAEDTTASEQEMKALAEKMHARAAAGEDFAALEKEIFQQSGLTGESSVEMTDALRGSLPSDHNRVFDLPPGTTSPIIVDANGYYIYKVVSKRAPSLENVRQQVVIEMQNQRSLAELKKIEQVKVNDTYFDKYDPPAPDPNEPEVDDD